LFAAAGIPMFPYQFSIRDGGIELEVLGYDAFDSDAGAIAFGKQVINDLKRNEPEQYFGWTMDIAQDKRTVASIPFRAAN
jgi:hypothetical protein